MFEYVRCSKNDVRVRSMFEKMVFDPSLKNRAFVFDYQKMNVFDYGQCPINNVRVCLCPYFSLKNPSCDLL